MSYVAIIGARQKAVNGYVAFSSAFRDIRPHQRRQRLRLNGITEPQTGTTRAAVMESLKGISDVWGIESRRSNREDPVCVCVCVCRPVAHGSHSGSCTNDVVVTARFRRCTTDGDGHTRRGSNELHNRFTLKFRQSLSRLQTHPRSTQ